MAKKSDAWNPLCHACGAPLPVEARHCPACGVAVATASAEIARDKRLWVAQWKVTWPEFRRYLIVFSIVLAVVLSAGTIYEWRSDQEPDHAAWFLNSGLYWFIGFAIIGFGAMVFLHIAANRMMKRLKEIDKTNDGR